MGSSRTTQPRLAVEGPGEAEALPLARGEGRSLLAQHRVVALRQPQDELVHARRLGGRHHRLGVGLGREPGDVLGHGAREQAGALRQVADGGAEGRARLRRDVDAVHPHHTLARR